MLVRIFALVVKEFTQLRRDRRSMAVVLVTPIIQLLIFGYALSTEVSNIPMVVLDASHSAESRDLVSTFERSGYFVPRVYVERYDDVMTAIDANEARVGLVIPPDYATQILGGRTATVQFLIDGSDPTVAQQALSAATLLAQNKSFTILEERLQGRRLEMPIDFRSRVRYNPNMESVIFIVPGLVGVILQMVTVFLTSAAIVRERELGTLEQLLVTPIRPWELILGKLLPYSAIAFFDLGLIMSVAVFWFGVPVRGSVPLLLLLSVLFLMFSLGIGLLISTVSRSQFQAMQLSLFTMLPTVLLSGFMFPIESMPLVAQWVASVVPLTYYLHIVRGIVLRGVGIEVLWRDAAVLGAVGLFTLAVAALRSRRKLG